MKNYFLYSILLLFVACGGSIEPIVEQLNPEVATLIFPADNTECNEGTVLNESQSSVVFQWNDSGNTDIYEVVIEDLESQDRISRETTNNEMDIVINRGKAYQWYVVSKSNTSEEPAISETWKFYNSGVGKENHAPFPADVVRPKVGGVLSSSTSITLEWSANDIDNDILNYEVYFDPDNPPTTSLGKITNSSIEVDAVSGITYYWFVKTTDEEGNTSDSGIFWFNTN